MAEGRRLMDERAVNRALVRIAHEVVEELGGTDSLVLVGIQRRGVQLAETIRAEIRKFEDVEVPLGSLDITLYRDDLQQVAEQPVVQSTDLPFDVTGKVLVLVDDVLYTGRTIRAALDEITDFGRPRRILLAVLVDRGHREIPIRADFVGKNVPTSASQQIKVKVPDLDGELAVDLVERGG
ncbi:MAG TPA: bifunctional pyr operon transcriptional regulator/uracil phosphoribosyltransferase PyrR [Gemmatimonadota bacterium]|jgi:pyrimidine operon attenuation protein/uracil phosphoribosyltransferase